MIKYKIERVSGQTLLVVQGQKGQQLSEREYYAIKTGQLPGLLKAEVVKKLNTFRISYNISGYISLREFLLNPLNKQSFARLLGNILTILKSLQNAYFNQQYILMDMNAAMVNPSTQEINFVYVPITFYECGTNLKDFLLSIIQHCSFAPGEDTGYVRDYIRILNNGINFSVFDLEEYVKRLGINSPEELNIKKCSRCGAVIDTNAMFCSTCGMKIGGLVTNNEQAVYDPLRNISLPKAVEMQRADDENYQSSRSFSDTVTNSADNVIERVQNMQHQQQQSQRYIQQPVQPPVQQPIQQYAAYLNRIKTGEQISVSIPSFRIGKDPFNNEYCIGDNSAISRNHVVIKYVNSKWFITDLNSTNQTYVNDMAIHPNMDVELFNGMNIRLANENFVFNIY